MNPSDRLFAELVNCPMPHPQQDRQPGRAMANRPAKCCVPSAPLFHFSNASPSKRYSSIASSGLMTTSVENVARLTRIDGGPVGDLLGEIVQPLV